MAGIKGCGWRPAGVRGARPAAEEDADGGQGAAGRAELAVLGGGEKDLVCPRRRHDPRVQGHHV